MIVQVRLFASAREAAGTGEATVEVASGGTVSQLLDLLCGRYPSLGSHRSHLRAAVNCNFSAESTVLHDGDEVAIIPPMSGG